MLKLAPNVRSAVLGTALLVIAAVVVYLRWANPQPAALPTRSSGLFGQFDRDGNGVARRDEVADIDRKQFEALLEKADQTQLGALTQAQFERVLHATDDPRAERDVTSSGFGSQGADTGDSHGENSSKRRTTEEEHADTTAAQGGDAFRPTEGRDLFVDLDANGDGVLSRSEFAAIVGEWAATPGDADHQDEPNLGQGTAQAIDDDASPIGLVNAAATAQPMPAPQAPAEPGDVIIAYLPQKLFEKLDKDRNGTLSLAEVPLPHRNRLTQGDSDRDGRLSLAEFATVLGGKGAAEAAASGEPSVSRVRRRGGLITPPAAGEAIPVYEPVADGASDVQSGADVPAWFFGRDANRDKQVAQDEWPATELAEFQRMDRNDDGLISLAEAAVAGRAAEESSNP